GHKGDEYAHYVSYSDHRNAILGPVSHAADDDRYTTVHDLHEPAHLCFPFAQVQGQRLARGAQREDAVDAGIEHTLEPLRIDVKVLLAVAPERCGRHREDPAHRRICHEAVLSVIPRGSSELIGG